MKTFISALQLIIDSSQENKNLVQLFLARAQTYQMRAALFRKINQKYQPISWQEWAEKVYLTAVALARTGVKAQQRVAIMAENCPEWTYADLGILSLGAVVVPIYPTSSLDDVRFILNNAECRILFISSQELLEKIRPILVSTHVEKIIQFNSDLEPKGLDCVPFDQWISPKTSEDDRHEYLKRVNRVSPSDLATIIYTSGTTGTPKGVMLTHHNFVANYLGSRAHVPVTDQDLALSFLPLSHVFERLAGYYFIMLHGGSIAYAESMKTVADDILIVRPTIAAAVPRFYEKIYAQICEKVEKASPRMKKIFYWAVEVGHKIADLKTSRQKIPFFLKIQYRIARVLVFDKLRKKLGGRIRFFISGGAPLAPDLARFFFAAGVVIIEGYGLTETSPVIGCNHPESIRFGTVGKPIPNVDVAISDHGEILTRGVCLMKGYYQNETETSQAIKDGWFHTGDLGEIDSEGYLKITGRIKDIIVTSGGKNISPQKIEECVLKDPLFAQIVVLGDKKNYLVALIAPNYEEVKAYAEKNQLVSANLEALLKNPLILQWVDSKLQKLTAGLASYEQIKYFALLERELTQADGEVTPTLKMRRQLIAQKYKTVIDELYHKGEFYNSMQYPNN